MKTLLLALSLFSGISGTTAWEVRTTGSDTANSGGFRWGAWIAAPSAPTVSNIATGGSVAANTYYFVLTYNDGAGETLISGQSSTTTTGSASTITVTAPSSPTGAISWSCYVGTVSGGPYFPQGTGLALGTNRVITATPPTTGTQPRGADYSQQDTAQITVNDAVANGTTTVTSATAGFTAAVVGNVVKINGAFYDIQAVTDSTTIVVDRTITTGSSLNLVVGGAFASPGQALSQAPTSSSNVVYIKSGAYTLANGTANTAGQKITTTQVWLVGFNTNRHPANLDTAPTLDAGAASMTVLTNGGNNDFIYNIGITNSGARASVTGFTLNGSTGSVKRLYITGCATSISGSGYAFVEDSGDSGCGGMTFNANGGTFRRYVSLGNTGTNPSLKGGNTNTLFDNCLIANMTVNSQTALQLGNGSIARNCVVSSMTGTSCFGITVNGENATVENCLVVGVSGSGSKAYAVNSTGYIGNRFINCGAYNNALDYDTRILSYQKIGAVSLTAGPFTNAGSGDYSLNKTAGGGALCRGTAFPGTFPNMTTSTGYPDIGLIQHQEAAGGGFVPPPQRLGQRPAPFPNLKITRKAG